MRDMPNAFWAFMYILLAVVLAITALIAPDRAATTIAVVSMAASLITGAFGFITGHAVGSATPRDPITPVNPAQPLK